MRVSKSDFDSIRAKAAERKAKRQEKAQDLWPKQKPQKISRPSRSDLEKACWDACSEYIRLRDKIANKGLCWYCGIRPIECAMHRIKRAKRATRFDERNLHGGCHKCNFEDGPGYQWQKFDAIFIRKLGHELFLELEQKSRGICQHSTTDLMQMAEMFKLKTQALRTTKG